MNTLNIESNFIIKKDLELYISTERLCHIFKSSCGGYLLKTKYTQCFFKNTLTGVRYEAVSTPDYINSVT